MNTDRIAFATDSQVAFAIAASATVAAMDDNQLQGWRIKRLAELAKREGGNAALGRRLGYKDGAFIGQMLRGERPVSEKTVLSVHEIPGYSGWFVTEDDSARPTLIALDNNPDFPAIRKVQFKLSAGVSGFGVSYLNEAAPPIVFQRKWYEARGLKPEMLFATDVVNGSMEPGLYDGDTVVVNTAQTKPIDGVVFAVNYEGELVIKRLVRDEGKWWLSSDNADKRHYPRKVCHEGVFLLGEIVHKQSEHI